jgi:hypothetical protein
MFMHYVRSVIIRNEMGSLINERINCVEQRPLQTLIVPHLTKKLPALYILYLSELGRS